MSTMVRNLHIEFEFITIKNAASSSPPRYIILDSQRCQNNWILSKQLLAGPIFKQSKESHILFPSGRLILGPSNRTNLDPPF